MSNTLIMTALLAAASFFAPQLERVSDAPHVLVFSMQSDGDTQERRHQLEQLAVNNSWFLYETGKRSVFDASFLSQFDLLVVNQTDMPSLTPTQQTALDRFVCNHGPLVWLNHPVELEALSKQLRAGLSASSASAGTLKPERQ